MDSSHPARRQGLSPITSRIALLATLAGLLLGGCSSPSARFHAGYIQTELSGELALGPANIGGLAVALDPIDIEDDLGIADASPSWLARAELDAGPVRFTGSSFQYSESGSGTLSGSFGGISVGTEVDSDLDFFAVKGAVTFDLLDFDVLRISPGVGIDVFDLRAKVVERTTGETEQIDELFPIPMLFVQAEADLGPVGLVVDAGGMDLSYDELEGTFFDVEGLLIFEPAEGFEVFAGYRWISIDSSGVVESQDYVADLTIQGWFLGGGVKF